MSTKLKFNKLRAKNFRSIGNMGLEIDYNASLTTLIASVDNGSGKSNLAIWALYFVLFGKPYGKDCKIGGLVNSKSGKDMLVELEFTTKGSEWLVKRGYKPAVFEIYKDGKLIESEAAKKDYQAYLQSVTGFDEKSFENIIALGVERFVPFVQMRAEDRRKFVERMLDLIVISQMNEIAKARIKVLKKVVEQIDYDINILESKYSGHVRTRAILDQKKNDRLDSNSAELELAKKEANTLSIKINLVSNKLKEWEAKRIPGTAEKVNKINQMLDRFKHKESEIWRAAKAVESMGDCPTCKQCVQEQHKSVIIALAEAEAGKLVEPMNKLQDELLRAQADQLKHEEANAECSRLVGLKIQVQSQLDAVNRNIGVLEAKMVDFGEDEQIAKEEELMNEVSVSISNKRAALDEAIKENEKHNQLLLILKDEGIKANIVAQYIPFLNSQINSILDQLNLYVQINIDSEFNVEMFAPNRKGQTLGNLSTGQLRRIDLAVLLAWREIAKNKASVDCNILILDEILENLSASGVEEFMDMWEVIGGGTNLIVISQRAAEFDQYFDRSLKYALKNELTVEVV